MRGREGGMREKARYERGGRYETRQRYEARREGVYGCSDVARRWIGTRWIGTRSAGTRSVGRTWVGKRWVGALVLQLEREIPVVPVEGVFLVSVGATVLEE
jgi:hypothetical protein